VTRTSAIAAWAASATGLLLILSACSSSQPTRASASRPNVVTVAAPPTESPSPTPTPTYTGPHFDSPEAAMRYLAAAWNRHDTVAMKRVTTPDGRAALLGMYDEAVNLRLDYCVARAGQGDYDCHFTHDYPASMHKHGVGHAEFIAGPARNPGWYMTVFEGCG
jgi:hypothetical protein